VRTPLAAFLLIALLAGSSPAAAADDFYAAYARALRYFDPGLSAAQSRRFAIRAVAEADAYALDARLIVALVATESGWNPGAVSAAGAVGLGQLMPSTARDLRVDPKDPEANLHGAARYLRSLLDRYAQRNPGERYVLAISAYNAGPGAVERYGTVPPFPETQAYVRRVIALWRRLAGR
jgi:soluble lytic murein transglycosylase-like protein